MGLSFNRLMMAIAAGAASVATGGMLSLTVADATPIDPVSSIGASGSGWVAIVKLKGLTSLVDTLDATKLTINVSDPGYDTSGDATVVSRTITGVAHLRRQYPNGASKMISTDGTDLTIYVTLDDWIYSGTTIVSAQLASGFYPSSVAGASPTNSNLSTQAYPRPLFGWVNPQLDLSGSTFAVEAVAAHRHARNQSQVACIKFTASDGTNSSPTITTSVAAISSIITGGQPPEVFKATLDVSTLTQGASCTVNAVAYPWLGNNPLDLSTSGVAWPTSLPDTLLKFVCDRTGGYGGGYAYVQVGSGGGVVSATPATAAASPYGTLQAAIAAMKVWNNANRGHNDVGGGTVRLMDASGADVIHFNDTSTGAVGGTSWLNIEKDPDAVGQVTLAWGTQTTFATMTRWRNHRAACLPVLTFTAAPSAGATSATLNANWTGPTRVYPVVFIRTAGGAHENRSVTLTNGATTATWSGGLGADCNATTFSQLRMFFGPSTDRSMVSLNNIALDLGQSPSGVVSGYSMGYFYNLTVTGSGTIDLNSVRPTTSNIAILAGSAFAFANSFSSNLGTPHLMLGNNIPSFVGTSDVQTWSDGDDANLAINNKIRSWSQLCASTRTLAKGWGALQNLLETIPSVNATLSLFNDGDYTSITNMVEFHTTTSGDRANRLYNDAAGHKVAPSGVIKHGKSAYCIWDNYNIKGDTFSSGAGSVGGWSFMYGVGNVGNVSLFGSINRAASDAPHNDNTDNPYLGNAWLSSSESNLFRTALGFTQAQIMAMFTNWTAAPKGSPALGGNLLPLSSDSNATTHLRGRVPAGMAVLRYDFAGNARRNDGTGAAGAYEF